MKSLLVAFIFSFLYFYVISVRLPCQSKTYTEAMIRRMSEQDGKALACLPNLGFDMCVQICERTTNCSYIKHYSDTLLCCLIKAENVIVSVSNCSLTFNNARLEFVPVIETKACGLCSFCEEAATCTTLKKGGHMCVPLIDLIEYCLIERYLVTGNYGVSSSRVTFSSVRNHPNRWHYKKYQIGSDFGWQASNSDQSPWIQVLFYKRRLVVGVITRGRGAYNTYIKEYSLEFLTLNNLWRSVKNTSGNITIFPGNVNGNTRKTNYLSYPIRTAGIRLKVISWKDQVIMGFDVLGC